MIYTIVIPFIGVVSISVRHFYGTPNGIYNHVTSFVNRLVYRLISIIIRVVIALIAISFIGAITRIVAITFIIRIA